MHVPKFPKVTLLTRQWILSYTLIWCNLAPYSHAESPFQLWHWIVRTQHFGASWNNAFIELQWIVAAVDAPQKLPWPYFLTATNWRKGMLWFCSKVQLKLANSEWRQHSFANESVLGSHKQYIVYRSGMVRTSQISFSRLNAIPATILCSPTSVRKPSTAQRSKSSVSWKRCCSDSLFAIRKACLAATSGVFASQPPNLGEARDISPIVSGHLEVPASRKSVEAMAKVLLSKALRSTWS